LILSPHCQHLIVQRSVLLLWESRLRSPSYRVDLHPAHRRHRSLDIKIVPTHQPDDFATRTDTIDWKWVGCKRKWEWHETPAEIFNFAFFQCSIIVNPGAHGEDWISWFHIHSSEFIDWTRNAQLTWYFSALWLDSNFTGSYFCVHSFGVLLFTHGKHNFQSPRQLWF
jgi:hypothetical protein